MLLGGLTAFGPLSIDMYLPSLPAIGRDLAASESVIQLTLTACLVGLALGQILAGPLSDRFGRRRPLLVGVAAYVLAALLCATAPAAPVLVGFRLVQGLAGAAGIVIARAIVRDLYVGSAAARYFSRLVLIMGLAPILAPVIGAQVLRFTSWHGIFLTLALVAALLWLQVRFWRLARRAYHFGSGDLRPIAAALMGSMLAFLIHGLIDNSYFLIDLAFIFWMTVALLEVAATELKWT